VATDSEEIVAACEALTVPVTMTGEHPDGGDRVHEVMTRTDFDIYVNIQGDEPTLKPEHLDLLLKPLKDGAAEVSTLKVAITAEEAQDPNVVKVVTQHDDRALYFSRSPIPYDRDKTGDVAYYKHIGLYAYTREALDIFHHLPKSSLEQAERLQQLRYLQAGIDILVLETEYDTVGVDTEADLQRVIGIFAAGETPQGNA
jgi:3-deoxy-manno-octulosonate cytidylyltransferase (CMP-KDO synthetase)